MAAIASSSSDKQVPVIVQTEVFDNKKDSVSPNDKPGNATTGQPLKAPSKMTSVKLADWKARLESLIEKPLENESRAEIKKLLSQDVQVKGNENLETAFYKILSAVLGKDKDNDGVVKLLIDSKHFKGSYRWGDDQCTALHRAVRNGRDEVTRKLVKEYRNTINVRDKKKRTALHYAAMHGSVDMTSLLLHSGATVNVFDDRHATPLHMVSLLSKKIDYLKQIAIAKQLLENGAEINTKDVDGDSPLHDAVKNSYHEVIEVLIDYGADTEYRDFANKVPQDYLHILSDPRIRDLFDRPTGRSARDKARRVDFRIPVEAPTCWGHRLNEQDEKYRTDDDKEASETAKEDVCKKFFAYIHFFYRKESYFWTRSVYIHDLLHDNNQTMTNLETTFVYKIKTEFPDCKGTDSDIRSNVWKWIHIPENQMSWVTDLVWCLTRDDDDPSFGKRRDAWDFLTRNIAQRKGVSHGSYMRMPHAGDFLKNSYDSPSSHLPPMGTQLDSDKAEDSNIPKNSEATNLHRRELWRNGSKLSDEEKISIVVPYIDFETKHYLDRDSMQTPRFVDKRQLEETSSEYSGLSGLYQTQTLDQSYYDMLDKEELKIRDQDQVVMRWFSDINHAGVLNTMESKDGTSSLYENETRDDDSVNEPGDSTEKDSPATNVVEKLLMVNQLWLWKLDKDTVITAFPDRYHQGFESTLFETIRQGDIRSYKKPEELIENILFKCVTFLEEFWNAGLGIHLLDIFEISLAKKSNDEVKCFRDFQKSSDETKLNLAQNISVEMASIHEVKDIRDELHLIRRILELQHEVVDKFSDVFWGEKTLGKHMFVKDCGLLRLIDRVKNLDRYAQRTVEGLDYFVALKQAQSALDEAMTAGRLNRYIMLFTLVTIVFTPLSFLTSLFAIPFDYFPRDDAGVRLSPGWTAKWMATGEVVTLAVVGLTGFGLWKLNYIKRWYHRYIPEKSKKNEERITGRFKRLSFRDDEFDEEDGIA